jgi:hypothetical protein
MSQNGNQFVELISRKILVKNKTGTIKEMQVLQLPVQSVHITTKVVSSNHIHGEVYSIHHYVIKFVSDLLSVSGFLQVFWFPPPIKLTTMI